MRFLVLDHYFGQDIEALLATAGDEIAFDVMPFEHLRAEALRVFPIEVATGLEAFARPELEPERTRYAAVLREILEDRFTSAPFDGIVLPSDTFFYVRAAPVLAHALGVPLVVVQKETTISEHTMRVHSQSVRRYAPPVADRMTVCSERQREFWLRAGADPSTISVTGQPRFDFYVKQTAPGAGPADPRVLFLSYAVDAYHPEEGGRANPWLELHRQTEQGLEQLARDGWRVLIKPHPQQSIEVVQAWRERSPHLWEDRISLVDPDADARKLIVSSDVIVGFQTTALLEAMLAGRPVVYTGWDEQAVGMSRDLIPFHDWGAEITVLDRPESLPGAVAALRGTRCEEDVLSRRRAIAEEYLGPLDGRASERVLSILTGEASSWAERRAPAQEALRRRLSERRAPLRLSRRTRAGLRTARRRVGAMLGR